MSAIRTIVIDDEPWARARLVDLLAAEADVEVVAECADAQQAVGAIERFSPDLLFLDVKMPGADGFSVLDRVGREHLPLVIFVTAFDRHAVKAFDVRAVDYLLKPFDRARFRQALANAREQIELRRQGELATRVVEMANQARPPASDRLIVKSGGRLLVSRFEHIDFIESVGNYVRIHIGDQSYLLRETMAALEARLDGRRFMRIHRSHIVSVDRIKQLQPTENGDYLVTLTTGARLTLSRTYKAKLHEQFGEL